MLQISIMQPQQNNLGSGTKTIIITVIVCAVLVIAINIIVNIL